MQTKKARSIFIGSVVFSVALSLLSFSVNRGGDIFEIYLNKKMVIQQNPLKDGSVKTLSLDAVDGDKQLEVRYYHCGMPGKARSLAIRDGQNKLVRTWQFADAGANGMVSIQIKEIVELRKKAGELSLWYSSKELPGGRMLVRIGSVKENKAFADLNFFR